MSDKLVYTGIGSRRTPEAICWKMCRLAEKLAERGYVLRSGGAEGADEAFECGVATNWQMKEIYLPWPKFNDNPSPLFNLHNQADAAEIAKSLHPAWDRLSLGARKLHTRNVYQVLGADLNSPSRFVVCWTSDGAETETSSSTGGTGGAIRLAVLHKIPVVNLANDGALYRLRDLLV